MFITVSIGNLIKFIHFFSPMFHYVLDGVVNHIEIFKNALEESMKTNPEMSIDEQIRSLVTVLEVTEEEKRRQSQIISTLEEWLSLEFPSCRLHLFGSSVSRLDFRGESDLDIFMETPTSMKRNFVCIEL